VRPQGIIPTVSKPEIFREVIPKVTTRRLADESFEDMIKFVVDLDRKIIAAGGGMHVDAETLLLENGSTQTNLWGANYYLDDTTDKRFEYTSMINIRPNQNNRKILIESESVRKQVRQLAEFFFEGKS
jgi:hypothetical protein